MIKSTTRLLFLLCTLAAVQCFADLPTYGGNFFDRQGQRSTVIVNNRPLAKINGKVFSALDVQKQMDRYLQHAHPQIFEEPESVFQFYSHSWKSVLQELVDNELMLMEAKELSYKLDKVMVEEELVNRFGSNYDDQIEKNGLTKDEATKIVENDLICKSMMWYRVWQKSMNLVTPQVVQDHYANTIQNKPSKDEWTYQMCTVRGNDAQAAEKIAKDVYKMFNTDSDTNLGSSLADAVKAIAALTPNDVSVKVSDEIRLTSKELSTENLSILEGLKPMEVSNPVMQKSRYDDQTVMRLFHLKEHLVTTPPSYDEISNEIRDALVGKEGEKVRDAYLNKLRKRFCYEDLIIEKMYDSQTQIFALSK